MENLDYHPNFKKTFNKLDKFYKERVEKILIKIINHPEVGKPMRNIKKGTRELYIKPFRFSYSYIKQENKIIILDLYHKKKQ